MCGIVGYVGRRQAQPILLNALSKLEYRGYDSCGIGVSDSGIRIYKDAVRVEELRRKAPLLEGFVGVGHTRWATHGRPSELNAHPHADCSGRFAVVHNGVITNYQALRQRLAKEGHNLASDTDTEVIAHLIEKYYRGDLEEALKDALTDIEGSYAVVILAADKAELVVARKESPLIIGLGDGENLVASDVPAILDYATKVIYLEDGDIGVVGKDTVKITKDGVLANRRAHQVLWSQEAVQKAGYSLPGKYRY